MQLLLLVGVSVIVATVLTTLACRVQVDEFIQTNRKRALRGVLTLWKEEYCLREKFRRAKHTLSLRLKRSVLIHCCVIMIEGRC